MRRCESLVALLCLVLMLAPIAPAQEPQIQIQEPGGILGTRKYHPPAVAHRAGVPNLPREAFDLAQQLHLKADAAKWAGNLASAYTNLEQWAEAERFNEQSTQLASQDAARPVASVMIAAEIAKGRGDFSRASALFER